MNNWIAILETNGQLFVTERGTEAGVKGEALKQVDKIRESYPDVSFRLKLYHIEHLVEFAGRGESFGLIGSWPW